MSRRNTSDAYGKALDLWQAPEGTGDPLVCIATTFTFDATFFETECIGRFLQMDGHPSETASVAYLIEREEKLAGARVHTLVDRRHARDKESLRWDILGVLVPKATQHAKLAVLVWKDHVRVIVGSGNLTEPGYRSNVEVFGALDLTRSEGGNKQALADTLTFIESLAMLGVGSEQVDAPKARLRVSVTRVRTHVKSWPDVTNRTDPIPIFNGPQQSALEALESLWPSNNPARTLSVVSPFFDRSPNDERAAQAAARLLAKRKERNAYVFVKSAPLPEGRTRIYAPLGMMHAFGSSGVEAQAYSLSALQQNEVREVHSKLLCLENDQHFLLMIGSSNFTAAGLGAERDARNCEANLVYRARQGDDTHKRLNEVWPDSSDEAIDLNSPDMLWEPCFEDEEDGAGSPPLPEAFQEALFSPAPSPAVRLRLAPGLPESWQIRIPGDRTLVTSDGTGPGTLDFPWTEATPPFVLEVGWRGSGGDDYVASWPVNVTNPAALPPPEVLRGLTLEELLEILASTRPLSAAVAAALDKRHRAGHQIDAALDPLKRLDSQAFLLRRTKRVARALDRLRERLERPALTKEAFDWRLRGVVGPVALAEAFVKEARLPGEARFNLAELALALRRVDVKVTAQGGLPVAEIRGCLDAVLAEIHARALALEQSAATSRLDDYVEAAFQEALAK
jgi:hypothetical protein